jgi:energy-converting hydrogenase A subunit R
MTYRKKIKMNDLKHFNGLIAIDCEGPLTKNDNALELSRYFIPDGERLFTQLSRYDDILAAIVKRPGYRAGNTLKLICPFFSAFGISNQDVIDYSARHILVMSGADTLLRWINEQAKGFIISTSYRPYIQALCKAVGFPLENTYSTHLDLDFLIPPKDESRKLQKMAAKIVSLPSLEWPSSVKSFDELPTETGETFRKIDEMIMNELSTTSLVNYLTQVEPVGGEEKARAVRESCEKTGQNISGAIYIGDSITDVEAFHFVRKGGGMTVAFNGNRYAIEAAELACLSGHSVVLAVICQLFWEQGRQGMKEMIEVWNRGLPGIKKYIENSSIGEIVLEKEQEAPSSIEWITDMNRSSLIEKSEAFRGKVRGLEIGRLG